MKGGTLTQRVVWALTGAVAVFVAALALLAYLTFDQMEDGLVDQILTTETERVAQHVAADSQFLPPQGARELGGSMRARSEEHTSELQSLMRISYAVFCLKKKIKQAYNKNKYPR